MRGKEEIENIARELGMTLTYPVTGKIIISGDNTEYIADTWEDARGYLNLMME